MNHNKLAFEKLNEFFSHYKQSTEDVQPELKKMVIEWLDKNSGEKPSC